MPARTPERHKKPGVCYAWTDDGLELPIIDVTHPAFAEDDDPASVDRVIQETMKSMTRVAQLPPAAIAQIRDGSVLMRAMMDAADSVLPGIATYLFKLGPGNLGDGYASDLDRAIAAGITPLSMRLRLRHMARVLADGLGPVLLARSGPLHFVNIGGGPALDSLNALILLWRERPELLRRPASIHVLDTDASGPAFGARALAALRARNAPLDGASAALCHVPYDWADPSTLRQILSRTAVPDAIVVGTSEGGLFEYPTDDQIVGNLRVLAEVTPPDFFFVGTVLRDMASIDPRMASMKAMKGRPGIRFLGLTEFETLARQGGWAVTATRDEAVHHVVRLDKAR
jgi:hypothetical protein